MMPICPERRLSLNNKPELQKHIIWSNRNLDPQDWKDDFIGIYGLTEQTCNEDRLNDWMVESNNQYLEDERCNLDIMVGDEILVIGDLGLWNGRHSGYKIIESGNLSDCLYPSDGCEYNEWFVDSDGEFRSTQGHHDGTNHMIYRVWKDGIDSDRQEDLLEAIYNGTATQEDMDAMTYKLGTVIGEVYGWEFPREIENGLPKDSPFFSFASNNLNL